MTAKAAERLDKTDTTGFTHAFCSAVRAYRNGCIPIGCAILDKDGNVIARGENSQYTSESDERIQNHPLAHAEINAILKVNAYVHDDIHSYTLYSTLESCPLCFGAIVMGGIKNVKFAAFDKDNEFTNLNKSVDFITKQNIVMTGPFDELQIVQIALIVCRRLEQTLGDNERVFNIYNGYCPEGVRLGIELKGDARFHRLLSDEHDENQILSYILSRLR